MWLRYRIKLEGKMIKMMLFNMDCVNFILKKGVQANGAGIHRKTHKAYVYFKDDNEEFQKYMKEWNEHCNYGYISRMSYARCFRDAL